MTEAERQPTLSEGLIKLRNLRRECGSISALAKRANIDPGYLSRILRDVIPVGKVAALKFEKHLSIPVKDFGYSAAALNPSRRRLHGKTSIIQVLLPQQLSNELTFRARENGVGKAEFLAQLVERANRSIPVNDEVLERLDIQAERLSKSREDILQLALRIGLDRIERGR